MAAIGIPFAACDEASRQTCLLVTHLTSNDILMGRGAPIAYFEGNIKFRELVKPRRADYSTATSQRRKHEIAMQIYAEVEQRNARFLQKVAT